MLQKYSGGGVNEVYR